MAQYNGADCPCLVPYDLDGEVVPGENELPIVVSIATRCALLRKELAHLEGVLVHLAEVHVRDGDLPSARPPEGDEYRYEEPETLLPGTK